MWTWTPNELEVSASFVEHARERTTAGSELTRIMLTRSREQVEQSRELLKNTVPPKIWHPQPPFKSLT